jgi:hypothetical protein
VEGRFDAPFSQCGGCKKVVYCSKQCQKKDWKQGHKGKCLAPSSLDDHMKLHNDGEIRDADSQNFLLENLAVFKGIDAFKDVNPRAVMMLYSHAQMRFPEEDDSKLLLLVCAYLGTWTRLTLELHLLSESDWEDFDDGWKGTVEDFRNEGKLPVDFRNEGKLRQYFIHEDYFLAATRFLMQKKETRKHTKKYIKKEKKKHEARDYIALKDMSFTHDGETEIEQKNLELLSTKIDPKNPFDIDIDCMNLLQLRELVNNASMGLDGCDSRNAIKAKALQALIQLEQAYKQFREVSKK